VAVGARHVVEAGERLVPRPVLDPLGHAVRRHDRHLELRHDAEQADGDLHRRQPRVVLADVDHVAGREHEPGAPERRREGRQLQPGPVGGGGNGSRDGLAVDVALVREGQAGLPEGLAERAERRAGQAHDAARRRVDVHDALQPVRGQERAGGLMHGAERVAGARDPDLRGAPHGRLHLRLATRRDERPGRERLVADPVGEAGAHRRGRG
jgi:hypothetical protein